MIFRVMAVKDRAANIYGQPFIVAHIGQAIRSFQDEINRKAEGNTMAAHPDDFDLYHLANFDDGQGIYTNIEGGPKQVAIGKQLVTTKE